MLRQFLCAGALATLAAAAQAEPLHRVVDDVVIDASLTADGLTACLTTIGGAKLSADHGVVIRAESGPSVWDELLPKTVGAETAYFKLPLRIELKRRPGAAGGSRVQFELGACQEDGMCLPVEIAVDALAVGASPGVACGG